MLSIIIPSYNDVYLQPTIDDIRKNARGEIEIIAILDGCQDNTITGATVIHNENRRGLRDSVNAGVAISRGEYILKCDSHCMFDEGFDVKLLADIEDNWVVIPRRYKLDTDKWIICEDDAKPIDYEKLVLDLPDRICGQEWVGRTKKNKDILVDETMVFQGSCWIMSRKHWDHIGELQEEGYGTFTQEPIEIALKTWLSGGKVMVNKKTWYAHQHRKFGRTHKMKPAEVIAGNTYSKDFWMNNRWEKRVHDLEWLVERFK
ncbi:MAG: glycosyltransferase family 2 protein [Candidatus Paceibacterota bacterium]|jgi:glycosyltransferase involved in cell wall biosynthesis|nr:glycosyltransferase [Candidatus Paceibacterota bacterium]